MPTKRKLEGLDEEEVLQPVTEEQARKPMDFTYWTVGGVDHKLKLTTGQISRLENKYNTNVMNIIAANDIPPLTVMLTIIQAAMIPWEHGTKYEDVVKLYDKWVNEGGSQQELYNKVITKTMAVSGFFSQEQKIRILEEIENS